MKKRTATVIKMESTMAEMIKMTGKIESVMGETIEPIIKKEFTMGGTTKTIIKIKSTTEEKIEMVFEMTLSNIQMEPRAPRKMLILVEIRTLLQYAF
jgi:hypothetical protein